MPREPQHQRGPRRPRPWTSVRGREAKLRSLHRCPRVEGQQGEEPPPELLAACTWPSARSLTLSSLTDPKVARDVQYRLSFKLDDTPAAAETYKRRRRGFNTATEYAIEAGYPDANPLAGEKRSGAEGNDVVDPGRIFQNERGDVLGTSSYWRVWQKARPIGLPPDKAASPLGRRPYDLRHTCLTNWPRGAEQ